MSKKVSPVVVYLILLALVIPVMGAGGGSSYPGLVTNSATLEKWRGQRFGMFIHWGPVSQTGYEISWSRGSQIPTAEYDQLYTTFNPVYFNAQEWVSLAKAAGMKYMVLTTRHHDGFCLFDSAYTTYDMMSTPFGRDVTQELADECAIQGIDFCTYHSVPDWYYPDEPLSTYKPYLYNLVTEIITKYNPMIVWFDNWEGEVTGWTIAEGCDLYKHCRDTKSEMLVTDRVYAAYLDTSLAQYPGDYSTPEQQVGTFKQSFPWESCITIGTQWAWKPNDTLKSLKECLQLLIKCNGGDGNLLFNIGPRGDGAIEPLQVSHLQVMGAWINSNNNGTALYNTRGGPVAPQSWGVTTHKNNQVYAHVFGLNWLGSHGTAAQTSTWDSSYTAAKAVDSDMATCNHNATGDTSPIWQIRTDANYSLTKVELLSRIGFEYRMTDYVVEFLNFTGDVNTQFALGSGGTVLYRTETLNAGGSPKDMLTIDLVARTGGPLTCNFIRVAKVGGETWLHMAEVQAYATNQPGTGQQITIPQMGSHTVTSAFLLANPAVSVPFSQTGDNVTLNMNTVPGDPVDTIVAMNVSSEKPANADIAVQGTITGTFANTKTSDNVYQQLKEVLAGTGAPSKKWSALEHKWTINVLKNNTVTFNVEAHHSANSEGDDFIFSYSTNNTTWTTMLTVTKTSDNNTVQSFTLPSSLIGTVYIRVVDANRVKGKTVLDTLYIDKMYISSNP